MFATSDLRGRHDWKRTLLATDGTVTHGRCQTGWRCEMTRSRMYALTAAAAGLYIFLCWAFADGLFSLSGDALWNSDAIIESTIWTYVMLAAIVVAGLYEASKIPVEGVPVTVSRDVSPGQMDDPVFWKLAMGSTYYALLWLPLRFFVGREWA